MTRCLFGRSFFLFDFVTCAPARDVTFGLREPSALATAMG